MEGQTKTNILNAETWVRLLYMIVFVLLSFVARMVIWVVAVLQFLLVLVTGGGNSNLRDLGQGTSKWSYQAFLFLTFNSNHKPFPFADWPEIDQLEESEIIIADEIVDSTESADVDDVPTFIDGEAEPEVKATDTGSETKVETEAEITKVDKP